MPRWAQWLLIGGLITAAGAVILYRMALRDNPARPAVGEAREALSGEWPEDWGAGPALS